MLFLLFLPPQGEDSLHSSTAPAWSPSHRSQSSTNFSDVSPSLGLQFFVNCSSMHPSNRAQYFRSRPFQRGSPVRSQALPANLLQRGLLSPWLHRSCQKPAPAWTLHRVTASFRHIHLCQRGVSIVCRWTSAPPLTSMGCRGTACLIMVFMGCRGIAVLVPGAPPPSSSLTLVSSVLFLSRILTPLSICSCPRWVFFPPLS